MTTIIAGSNCVELAQSLSQLLGLGCADASVHHFSDQELRIQVPLPLHKQDVIIVQSVSPPVNDNLMELLLTVDAVRRAGSNRIIVVVPYLGYSRQDRPSYLWGPISARLVANMIECAGVDHMITIDLHSKQQEGFFHIGVQNIEPTDLLCSALKKKKEMVVISPDIGGLYRAQRLAELMNIDLVIANKVRKNNGECQINEIVGDIRHKDCIMIDDIIDTGGTLIECAKALLKRGASSVQALAAHGVLSGDAIYNLQNSDIGHIAITTSIKTNALPDKFSTVCVNQLLVDAIKKII